MKHTASLTLMVTALTACGAPTEPVTAAEVRPDAALKVDCTTRKGAKGSLPGVDVISTCSVPR